MRKLFLFMMVSLDGYFEGPDHDLSWHNTDEEFVRFAIEQLDTIDTILFGRRTYDMMAEFWPSKQAIETDPETAERMNEISKVVFSRTLENVTWENSRLGSTDVRDEVMELKQAPGKDIAVFGSSNLCLSLLEDNLLDELRIMVNPVIIGAGTPLFAGINHRTQFKLANTREFASGNVLLTYIPTTIG